jgi:glutathione synthase/RimK-type ligase-like ATP-grasp enzyme
MENEYNIRNKYWVGPRKSDLQFTKRHFRGEVCLFSSDKDFFQSRINQNYLTEEMREDIRTKLIELSSHNPDIELYFYNQSDAYKYGNEIIKYSRNINNPDILMFLNDKLLCKQWFMRHGIPTPPFETINGEDIIWSQLEERFEYSDCFVVQKSRGSGGVGTFLLNKENSSILSKQFENHRQYIVSPHIENVSVNVHTILSESEIVLTPASIQIIENVNNNLVYRGADFIAFRELPPETKEALRFNAHKIAKLLKTEGYIGVAGIDFIIDKNQNIYCTEINPRFQSSSVLVDRFLTEKVSDSNGHTTTSLFKMSINAFSNSLSHDIDFSDEINYSCYYYYNDINNVSLYFEKLRIYELYEDLLIDKDGLTDNDEFDNLSYLYRVIFPHKITQINSTYQLWINDNIRATPEPTLPLDLKIALLNQGVRSNINDRIKSAAYNGIDIRLTNTFRFPVNCAYNVNLSRYSPFLIEKDKSAFRLFYYKKEIDQIEIEKFDFDENSQMLYLSTDRLRIKMIHGCEYKNLGVGCKFCNVSESDKVYSIDETMAALQSNPDLLFRHMMIGGGTCLSSECWDNIISLSKRLKSEYKDKTLSLMSVPPSIDVLHNLKNAGVDEAAFNIEIYSEKSAEDLMPGKSAHRRETYFQVLSEAVKVFGKGNVRSAIIVGLEDDSAVLSAVEKLSAIGVQPCLSVFRQTIGSVLSDRLPPTNTYLKHIYLKAESIAEKYDLNIGPKCIECRNNMLSI